MVILDIAKKYHTIAEFLELECRAEVRHEFNNGTITEMAGGNIPHNIVKGEVYTEINLAIRRRKTSNMALNSDTKVRLEAFNRFVYPDVTVSDGRPEFYQTPDDRTRRDVIINPLLIVEVLSDDTRAYDKKGKFEEYQSIPSFREYLLVEPEKTWVKWHFLSNPASGEWETQILTDRNAVLHLRSIGIDLPMEDIYRAVDKFNLI